MNLAGLSIKRPTFITAIIVLILAVGYLSMKRLGVDLFPDVTFPIVNVTTVYPGAGPQEIETQVSKVIEEEISSISGVKSVRSTSREGVSLVLAEFTLETDVKYAEQQIKDRVNSVKRKLPSDVEDPVVRRIDPAEQPIMIIAVGAEMSQAALYDLAKDTLKPQLEQTAQVGLVDIIGGRKREIHVELDRNKLKSHEISATAVANRLKATGVNIPAGKISTEKSERVYRTVGEFETLKDIEKTVVNFVGNDVPVNVAQLGRVIDTLEDEKSLSAVNGKPALFLYVFRQSGANTIAVVDAVKKKVEKINSELSSSPEKIKLEVVRDTSKFIRANVDDVNESIFVGILLTIIVVYFFLGSWRSTFITGMALPNSLLGAFILMAVAGFSINIMTLLALSLAVGLLIDDAIVVRENIFRYQEQGLSPKKAAYKGTVEVTLAVVATTLTVIAVFGPIGFLSGVVGQFFKEFGLTICFAMLISLFDALTIAPMLSAYFPAKSHGQEPKGVFKILNAPVRAFDRFQSWMEDRYEGLLRLTMRNPIKTLLFAFVIFAVSLYTTKYIPKTFLPAQDQGEFAIGLELPPGTSLREMKRVVDEIDQKVISQVPEIKTRVVTVGNRDGESNVAEFIVELLPSKQRKKNTIQVKEQMRDELKQYAFAQPKVKDIDFVGGGRPFNVSISGPDDKQVKATALALLEKLKNHPGLKDVEISDKPGKPEFQVYVDQDQADRYGVSAAGIGQELRTLVEGTTPAVFREMGREYDIRVRLKEDQRDIKQAFHSTFVPNINNSLIKLSSIAKPIETVGPANITRQDRGRYVNIAADVAADGPGLGAVVTDIKRMWGTEVSVPQGVNYRFVGQAENFGELISSMIVAMGLGILFIYLVLASLYESFVTPFTIMLVLPLAACGAFFGLLITGKTLDLFSMIGCVMLFGIATKNSILLVDRTKQLVDEGMDMSRAIIEAGRTRLRPILMTSLALIAGAIPIAVGLNEASKQRTSMGVALIGGLVTSTLLTLIVVPAAYGFIEKFRLWSLKIVRRIVGLDDVDTEENFGAEATPRQFATNVKHEEMVPFEAGK